MTVHDPQLQTLKPSSVQRAMRNLLIVSALYSLAMGMTRPLVPLFAYDLGSSSLMIGILIGAVGVLPMFLALNVGFLADHLGPRRVLLAGAFIFLISTVMRAGFPNLTFLLLSQLVIGVSQLLVIMAAHSYLAGIGSSRDRSQRFGSWQFASSGGDLFGPITGGILADLLISSGLDSGDAYRWVFTIAGVIAAVSLALAVKLPKGAAVIQRDGEYGSILQQARQTAPYPGVAVGSLISMAFVLSSGIRQSFFPVLLAAQGFSTTLITVLYSAHPFASMVILPFLGRMTKRLGERSVVTLALVVTAVGSGLIPIAQQFSFFLILSTLTGIGAGLGITMTMVIVAGGAPRDQRGLALGIRQLANRVASTVGPALFGIVAGLASLGATFYVAASFAVLGMIPLAVPAWRPPKAPDQGTDPPSGHWSGLPAPPAQRKGRPA
ncbi:MAG: MFS transporter [Thermaerobacterales bacterium]